MGFVPTMGALHEGHLALGMFILHNFRRLSFITKLIFHLVRRSLASNDHTVVSIFVNPAQFAPHEDLATYPNTLPHDLELLSAMSLKVNPSEAEGTLTRTPSAVFLPSVSEMYPSGISQSIAEQKGTFVEVQGFGHQMEGKTRPTFFRGVATVVMKLFHAIEVRCTLLRDRDSDTTFNTVQPTQAYFGQKDIQQALLLRRMARDMLISHPSPDNVQIVPTVRCATYTFAHRYC